jgi:hypothetical protein
MATDTQTKGEIPVSDYRMVSKTETQLTPETLFAPTCMIWCIGLALGFIVAVMLLWSIPELLNMFNAG